MAAFAMWHGLSNPGVFQVAFNWFGLFVLFAVSFDTNNISTIASICKTQDSKSKKI